MGSFVCIIIFFPCVLGWGFVGLFCGVCVGVRARARFSLPPMTLPSKAGMDEREYAAGTKDEDGFERETRRRKKERTSLPEQDTWRGTDATTQEIAPQVASTTGLCVKAGGDEDEEAVRGGRVGVGRRNHRGGHGQVGVEGGGVVCVVEGVLNRVPRTHSHTRAPFLLHLSAPLSSLFPHTHTQLFRLLLFFFAVFFFALLVRDSFFQIFDVNAIIMPYSSCIDGGGGGEAKDR